MKLKLIRDICILALFCGSFYVSSLVVGQLKNEDSTAEETTNFSPARIEGDQLVQSQDWEGAVGKFKGMTEADPFNGYAWYQLGSNYNRIRNDLQKEIVSEKSAENPADLKITELQNKVFVHDQLAMKALEKSREFLRYRAQSLIQLAIIHADREEYDVSLECLEEFVEDGGWVYNGLAELKQFGVGGRKMASDKAFKTSKTRLHQFEKFWVLSAKEYETRLKSAVPRKLNPNLGMRQ